MRWCAAAAVALIGAGLIAGAAARNAALPQQAGTVDLLSQANVRLDGSADSFAGTSVAAAGDFNGDGIGDVIVGAPSASNNGRTFSGSAYVVFGRPSAGTVSLDSLGDAGLRIDGAAGYDVAGSSVAGAGDVNGDGLADVVVGAPGARSGANTGLAYVVFGRRTGGTVDLAALGSGGYEIDGAPNDYIGAAVAGGRDVNGDGRPDLVIGGIADTQTGNCAGRVYVVYGQASTSLVNLPGSFAGFRLDGAAAGDEAGYSMAMVGDMTGDGLSEVIVGAPSPLASGCGSFTQRPGEAYVIFSGPGAPNLSFADPGFTSYGYVVHGAAVGGDTGYSVAGAGDVNGDGRADVIVGELLGGRAYVLFGRGSRDATPVNFSAFAGGGFAISGASADEVGCGVAAAGDINGDGRPDVIVGADKADNNGRTNSGSAYVLYGTASPLPVDLTTLALGSEGFRIDGPSATDGLGCEQTIAAAGDFNGDGRPDLIVGAPGAKNSAGVSSGVAYVVYGFGTPGLAYDPLGATVGTKIAPHGPTLLKRTGNATFAVSPALPSGLSLDSATGVVSGTPAKPEAATAYTVTMTDLAGQVSASLTITITGAGSPPPRPPAPPPPPMPPPPPPPPKDTKPPTLGLRGTSSQRLLVSNEIVVTATCSEACTLTATGAVTIAHIRAVVGLKPAHAKLRQPGAATLKLRLSAAAKTRLRRLLTAGAQARVRLRVRAVDRSGNATRTTRTILVRP